MRFAKKKLVGLAFVLLAGAFLMATCPDKEAHRQVATLRLTKTADRVADSLGLYDEGQFLLNMFSSEAATYIVEKQLDVQDYGILSVGKVHYENHTYVATIGIATHVFCVISEDDLTLLILQWKEKQQHRIDHALRSLEKLFH